MKTLESFSICGSTNLNRIDIWEKTKQRVGMEKACQIMPKAYLLPKQLPELEKDPSSQYILKTLWSGARTGVKLYDDKKQIAKDRNKYQIAQVYIKNPILVNGHKFDVRFFLVVCCGIGVFLYRPGYCVYTKKPFRYEGLDRECKINQVFTNERHYDINDLPRIFKDVPNIDHNSILNRLIDNLKIILASTKKLCCDNEKGCHLFGIDVEITTDYKPLIIEINSAPSLDFNEKWKKQLITPMLGGMRRRDFNNSNWSKL